MNKLYSLIASGVICATATAMTNAADSIYCNNCSIYDKKSSAESWTSNNTPRNGTTKQLNVIDLTNNSITTYDTRIITRYQSYVYPYGYTYQPVVTETQTPSDIANTANNLFAKKSQFSTTINNIVIPESVIPSSWAFTNCAYCANDVSDYIANNTNVHTLWLQMVSIAGLLGVSNGPTAERHVIKLADGGKIEIEIKLTDTSVTIDVVKITDPNNNDVPKTSSQLHSGMTFRTSEIYFAHFDHYLIKLGYISNRDDRTGIVTIQECRSPGEPYPNTLPPCL